MDKYSAHLLLSFRSFVRPAPTTTPTREQPTRGCEVGWDGITRERPRKTNAGPILSLISIPPSRPARPPGCSRGAVHPLSPPLVVVGLFLSTHLRLVPSLTCCARADNRQALMRARVWCLFLSDLPLSCLFVVSRKCARAASLLRCLAHPPPCCPSRLLSNQLACFLGLSATYYRTGCGLSPTPFASRTHHATTSLPPGPTLPLLQSFVATPISQTLSSLLPSPSPFTFSTRAHRARRCFCSSSSGPTISRS